jgi:hypothetical protein
MPIHIPCSNDPDLYKSDAGEQGRKMRKKWREKWEHLEIEGCRLMVLLVPESMAASASLLVLYLRMTEGVASSSMMSVISPNFCNKSHGINQ